VHQLEFFKELVIITNTMRHCEQ